MQLSRLRSAVFLLGALALALPTLAGDFRAEPQTVVQAIDLHLDNLKALNELPAASNGPGLKTVPQYAITQMPVSYIQQAYLREAAAMTSPQQSEAGLIIEAVTAHPSLVGRIAPALQKAMPDDPEGAKTAAARLWRYAAEIKAQNGKKESGSESADEAWRRLERVFEGKSSGKKASVQISNEPANDSFVETRQGDLVAVRQPVVADRPHVDAWLGSTKADPVNLAFAGMDPVLASELLELVGAPLEYNSSAAAWLRTGNAGAKAELAERPDLLQAFYNIRRQHEGALREKHESLPGLVTAYRGAGATKQSLRTVLDHTVERDGGYAVEHNALTWNALSVQARDEASRRLEAESFGGARAVKLFLQLAPTSDLAAIARRYAMGRDPKALERYLRLRRKSRDDARVSIPLENLLPRWVQESLEGFDDCTGPNCINAALDIGSQRHEKKYVTGAQMLERLGADFEKVPAGGELAVGDILIYTDSAKQFQHMAAYVGDGYVFNKSSASRYSPYVFQSKASVDSAQMRAGGLRVVVFRRKA
jgi:hypothetical protein